MWGRKRGVNLLETPEMDAFFERLDRLNQAEVQAMAAAWHAKSPAEHEAAWAAVRAAGVRDGLTKEIERVRDKALERASRGTNSVPYTVIDFTRETRIEAGGAIADAAIAGALAGRLDGVTYDFLVGPWLRATEGVG
jgi:hypothetical protein